ncbi:MAG: DUF302 domain-containing protein [Gammaproteobacteria bacterium]|jgi:uncharacterized protein (DUF302 family)
MRRLLSLGLLLLLAFSLPVSAEELLMVRVKSPFPETMLKFQEVIKEHGYKLSRVQRVDVGLSMSGYKTDKYRVVFFGKEKQDRWIIRHHPKLIPYLPLKVAIYAENEDTLLVAPNLDILINAKDPHLKKMVKGWEQDLQVMFREMHDYGMNN